MINRLATMMIFRFVYIIPKTQRVVSTNQPCSTIDFNWFSFIMPNAIQNTKRLFLPTLCLLLLLYRNHRLKMNHIGQIRRCNKRGNSKIRCIITNWLKKWRWKIYHRHEMGWEKRKVIWHWWRNLCWAWCEKWPWRQKATYEIQVPGDHYRPIIKYMWKKVYFV